MKSEAKQHEIRS